MVRGKCKNADCALLTLPNEMSAMNQYTTTNVQSQPKCNNNIVNQVFIEKMFSD